MLLQKRGRSVSGDLPPLACDDPKPDMGTSWVERKAGIEVVLTAQPRDRGFKISQSQVDYKSLENRPTLRLLIK